ncbi:hypothetical protein BGZ95_000153 [Linnemannia exigua]|uniref:Uncharacterized protein n=1 Tax=Linnemannia exigua TaxID=604196 RepID=A0AAD4DJS4_9FUNG|nr:hypothetical protein BGZ95_000153 [Linnemannia exigua]
MRRPNVNSSTSISKPAAARGNAANRRLSQTRSNLTSSQQRLQEQRLRRTSQFFNFDPLSQQSVITFTQVSSQDSNQDEEEEGRSSSKDGRRSGRHASASKSPQLDATTDALRSASPQPETQEWLTQKLTAGDEEDSSGEEQEESAPQDTISRRPPQKATRYYTQSPSPSSRRSPSQPAAHLSQSDEPDTHMPSTDPQQQQPSSADSLGLSQLVCGQRLPTFSPTPNARPSTQTQSYGDFDYDTYQEDLPDYYDGDNNDRNTVAEDSLAASSGEVLSWSVTPQRAVDVGSVEAEVKAEQEDSHGDQEEGIVASTFPNRRSESHSLSGAEEPESEEKRIEQRTGSMSPEVESEGHDDTSIRKQQSSSSQKSITLRTTPKTSSDNMTTRKTKQAGKRDPERKTSIPDHVKQQLDEDTLDLLAHNPSIQQVFLCIEIPDVPEITGSMSKTALKTTAPRSGRKRVAEGSPKQKTRTKSPSLQPPSKQTARLSAAQKRTSVQRRSGRHAGPRQPGTYYEARISDDEEEEVKYASEDTSGSDEQEVHGTSSSINPRLVSTHLLPPKKRIRNNVSFQEDILQLSQEQQQIRHEPTILHDSDSDGEHVPGNVQSWRKRRRHVGGVTLSSVSPSPGQEQENELEQDQGQDEQRSPSPSPPRSDQENAATLHQSDDVGISDNKEQGQGMAQRWEIAKLHQVWKDHDVRWPLHTASGRGGDQKEEEYNAYFVFGSALPLPK